MKFVVALVLFCTVFNLHAQDALAAFSISQIAAPNGIRYDVLTCPSYLMGLLQQSMMIRLTD